MTPASAMKGWISLATPAELKALAKKAKTSVRYLNHVATGYRSPSAALAQRLAAASKELNTKSLILDQRALCETCAACPIADKRKAPLVKPKAK